MVMRHDGRYQESNEDFPRGIAQLAVDTAALEYAPHTA
jgi:hypothetical protein